MPYQLWSQDNFSKGELSPYMYARAMLNQYHSGLKTAQNVLTYPTGAAGKRFGTLFQTTLANITAFNQIYFQTFQYLDECTYQLVFSPTNIAIHLEGILIANVTTTFDAASVYNLSTTVLGAAFRVAGKLFKPFDLTRSANAGNVIVSVASNQWTMTNALTPGNVLPIRVTTSGALPTTTPQIKAGITYFAYVNSSHVITIYPTAKDAKFQTNGFILTDNGSGTNTVYVQNTWTFSNSSFKNLPFYDFNGPVTSYDAITFTPSAVIGNAVTITLSGAYAPLTSAYVGGAFFGAGGSGRITAVADTSHFTVAVQTPFDGTGAIQGSLCLLAEPAWSDARGWPQKCSSYQNRALFANSDSLPNGFWTSVINDYTDFGDLTTDDDDAISWYPSSNDINFIRFIVPFRSITIHTNTGIYSSPLSEISSITPKTFTLQLQDSTPADVLQPQAIDNQIIVLSGNDVHTMIWDGINNAYTSNIVSVSNEQTIRTPVDETAFADLTRAGSRYVFIVNANGTMAVFQTLQSEQVSGFTTQMMEQSYGSAQFLQAASSFDGRCWFVNQRQIATAGSAVGLNAIVSPTVLQALGVNLAIGVPTAITFATSGTLATSSPQVTTTQYYWGVGLTVDNFNVYLTQEDAIAGTNAITWSSIGVNTTVKPWPLSTIFTLEELSQDVHLDCAVYFNGAPTSTITTGTIFNAQEVKMVGDGFGFDAIGFNNQVVFDAHGVATNVSTGYIGFPINLIIEPMPLVPPPNQNTTLTKPNHIRSVRFMFNNTIGGTINGVPIALESFQNADIGQPPFPARGFFEMSIMSGWDDFNFPSFTIEHDDPFNIELIGVFYSVDT
jgi:hypothetical protein